MCAVRNGADNLRADVGVHLYLLKFVVSQRARFVQDAFGNENLAHIVNPRGINQIGRVLGRQAQSAGNHFGIARH